jgi:hypothetical protein
MQLDIMMEAIEGVARERGVPVDAILDAFANAVGTLTCTRPGAIPAFPSLQRAREFMRSK